MDDLSLPIGGIHTGAGCLVCRNVKRAYDGWTDDMLWEQCAIPTCCEFYPELGHIHKGRRTWVFPAGIEAPLTSAPTPDLATVHDEQWWAEMADLLA